MVYLKMYRKAFSLKWFDVNTLYRKGENMKKKKFFLGVALAATALGLAACSGKKDPTPNPGDDNPPVVQEFVVQFNTGTGGSSVASQTVKAGEKVKKPAQDPTRENYVFDGWYKDSGYVTEYDFNSEVNKSFTIYAKWKPVQQEVNKYSVTYNKNNHGADTASLTDVTALPAELPVLSEEGWIFGGWYYDTNFDNKANGGDEISANTILYAKWTKDGSDTPEPVTKYSVTFDKKGHGADTASLTDVTALPAELPVLSEEGWIFGGWYYDTNFDNKANGGDAITKNTTLYAKWSEEVEGPIELTQIQISPESVSIVQGQTSQLSVLYTPHNAQDSDKVITWSSSNENVATVDQSGLVSAVAVGNATITATSANGKVSTCSVTVTEQSVPLRDFTIQVGDGNTDRVTLTPTHSTETLVAKLNPSNATGVKIVWTSSDPAIAKVTPNDENGLEATVEMLLQGTEQITITATVVGDETKTASVFCTADTYYGTIIKEEKAPLILNETFVNYDANAKLPEWSGAWGTKGVYGAAGDGATYDTHYVSILHNDQNGNNRATLVDPDGSSVSGGSARLVVDYGKVDGTIIGYANVRFSNPGTSWAFMQFNGVSANKSGEVLGLRLAEKVKNDKKYLVHYRLDGGTDTLPQDASGQDIALQVVDGGTLRIYYEFTWDETKEVYLASIIINGTQYLKDVETSIKEFRGIQFVSSNKANKSVSVDNIAVANNPVGLDKTQEKLTASITDLYNQLTAVEETYTEEHKALLDELFAKAKADIAAVAVTDTVTLLEAKAQANEIYSLAVQAMNAVETKADTALNDAKAAATDELNGYVNSSDYTINKVEYDAAIEAGLTAIANAKTEDAVALALVNAKAVIDEIQNDATALDAIKTAAIEELSSFEGGSDNFTITTTLQLKQSDGTTHSTQYSNVSTYQNAYQEGVRLITTASEKPANQTASYLEAVAEIEAQLASAKEQITRCSNNDEMLAEIKSVAQNHINRYRADERTADKIADCEVEPGQPGYYDKDVILQELANEIKLGYDNIESFVVYDRIQAEVTKIEDVIDTFIKSFSDVPFDDLKSDLLNELQTYYNDKIDGQTNAEMLAEVEEAYNAGVSAMNAITSGKAVLSNAYSKAKDSIDVHFDKYVRFAELELEAETQKALIQNDTVKAEIDSICTEAKSQLTVKVEEDNCQMNDLATITNQAKADMAEKVATLKATKYTITLKDTNGNVLKDNLMVLYGEDFSLADLHVTAKTIVRATYMVENVETEIDDSTEITVYDNMEITVTTQDIDAFEGKINWTSPLEVTEQLGDPFDGINNSLFSLSIPNALYVNGTTHMDTSGKTLANGKITINNKEFTSAIRMQALASENTDMIKFVVKDNLSSLSLDIKKSENNGAGNRTGHLYYNISNIVDDAKLPVDVEWTEISSDKTVDVLAMFTNVAAGSVVRIYFANTSTKSDGTPQGANLFIGGIDAVVAEDRVNQDVTIHWNDLDITENYRYYEIVNVPADVPAVGGKFVNWYYMNGSEKVVYTGGETFASGSTIEMMPEYQTSNVTITLMNGDVVFKEIKDYIEPGSTGIAAPIQTPEAPDENHKFEYWYETDEAVPFDWSSVAAGDNKTLYAHFGEIEAVADQILATSYPNISKATLNLTSEENYFTLVSGGGSFTYNAAGALEAGGSSRTVTITANDNVKSMTVIVELSIGDSSGLTSKNGNITVTGTGQIKIGTDFVAISSQAVAVAKNKVSIEITLTAGQTVTFTPSTSRLNFYSAVASVMPKA